MTDMENIANASASNVTVRDTTPPVGHATCPRLLSPQPKRAALGVTRPATLAAFLAG